MVKVRMNTTIPFTLDYSIVVITYNNIIILINSRSRIVELDNLRIKCHFIVSRIPRSIYRNILYILVCAPIISKRGMPLHFAFSQLQRSTNEKQMQETSF